MTSGTVKTQRMILAIVEMGNPQPSSKSLRGYGCSSQTRCWWVNIYIGLRYSRAHYESSGIACARLKLKGIDGRAPPGVEPAA